MHFKNDNFEEYNFCTLYSTYIQNNFYIRKHRSPQCTKTIFCKQVGIKVTVIFAECGIGTVGGTMLLNKRNNYSVFPNVCIPFFTILYLMIINYNRYRYTWIHARKPMRMVCIPSQYSASSKNRLRVLFVLLLQSAHLSAIASNVDYLMYKVQFPVHTY